MGMEILVGRGRSSVPAHYTFNSMNSHNYSLQAVDILHNANYEYLAVTNASPPNRLLRSDSLLNDGNQLWKIHCSTMGINCGFQP